MGKGQKFFNDGFVNSISFTEPNDAANENFVIASCICYFVCKVRAEMKKRVTYQPSVEIRTTSQDGLVDFIPAVKYGLEHEDYIRYIVQQCNQQNVVRQTGLVIHPLEQYIAASPDGLI
ncbi:hypothetical protein TNCV_1630851 [Trichonephila clavipes]|nr:hypothetical protein TNCV_1630851 [Trichonephila clavipes]